MSFTPRMILNQPFIPPVEVARCLFSPLSPCQLLTAFILLLRRGSSLLTAPLTASETSHRIKDRLLIIARHHLSRKLVRFFSQNINSVFRMEIMVFEYLVQNNFMFRACSSNGLVCNQSKVT